MEEVMMYDIDELTILPILKFDEFVHTLPEEDLIEIIRQFENELVHYMETEEDGILKYLLMQKLDMRIGITKEAMRVCKLKTSN